MPVKPDPGRAQALLDFIVENKGQGRGFVRFARRTWPDASPEEITLAVNQWEDATAGRYVHFGALAWARELRREKAAARHARQGACGPSRVVR